MAGGYQIGLWSLLIAAAICDLIWHKIFNWVNGLFLLGGLFTQFYFGGSVGLSQAFLAVVVAFHFDLGLLHEEIRLGGGGGLLGGLGFHVVPRKRTVCEWDRSSGPRRRRLRVLRLLPLAVIATGLVVGLFFGLHDYVSLDYLTQARAAMRAMNNCSSFSVMGRVSFSRCFEAMPNIAAITTSP